jgi:SAM-dependent methyltransferase
MVVGTIKRGSKVGSEHTGYRYDPKPRLRERLIIDLIEQASLLDGTPVEIFKTLDVGCGSGHLLKAGKELGLDIKGADIDQVCVDLSSKFSEAFLIEGNDLQNHFAEDSFDCLVFSHSLEHFDSPFDAIEQAKVITKKYLIFAVPNPGRLQTILFNIFRINYANRGHLCCWDRSHFTVFLENRCKLELIKWESYIIRLTSLPVAFIKLLKRSRIERSQLPNGDIENLADREKKSLAGKFRDRVANYLQPIEIFLAKVFPYFADELIVLTKIKSDRAI